MKNLLKSLSIVILISSTLISCDKNDDLENSIIGTWTFSKKIITELNGKSVEYNISSLVDMSGEISIYENGTLKSIDGNIAEWKLVDNGTVIEVTYPKNEDDDPIQIDKTPFTFKGEQLVLTIPKLYLDNLDEYPNEGRISFSKFNNMFDEKINEQSEIEVPAKYYLTRKN